MAYATVAAWGVAGLGIACLLGAALMSVTVTANAPRSDPIPPWALAGLLVALLSFPLCGGLVASRRPRNPLGWLFGAMGVAFGTSVLVDESLLAGPSRLDASLLSWLGWTQGWIAVPFLLLGPIVVLLFPDGRPASPRWRPLVAVCAVWLGLQTVAEMVPSREAVLARPYPPPFEVPAAVAEAAAGVGSLGVASVALFPLAALSLFVRYRSAGPVQRQQLKWFLYAAALVGAAFVLLGAAEVIGQVGLAEVGPLGDLVWVGALLTLTGLPIAASIAIVRHRLFDIDVLINRTLVYGSLSAILAATFAGIVVLSQTALRPLTGGSELAVAASTLVTLALVQPLRARIQGAVDRRFYRSRYDAARTLDAFTSRLRDEVDLDDVRSDVLQVIGDTFNPAHAGVWLRGEPR